MQRKSHGSEFEPKTKVALAGVLDSTKRRNGEKSECSIEIGARARYTGAEVPTLFVLVGTAITLGLCQFQRNALN